MNGKVGLTSATLANAANRIEEAANEIDAAIMRIDNIISDLDSVWSDENSRKYLEQYPELKEKEFENFKRHEFIVCITEIKPFASRCLNTSIPCSTHTLIGFMNNRESKVFVCILVTNRATFVFRTINDKCTFPIGIGLS